MLNGQGLGGILSRLQFRSILSGFVLKRVQRGVSGREIPILMKYTAVVGWIARGIWIRVVYSLVEGFALEEASWRGRSGRLLAGWRWFIRFLDSPGPALDDAYAVCAIRDAARVVDIESLHQKHKLHDTLTTTFLYL